MEKGAIVENNDGNGVTVSSGGSLSIGDGSIIQGNSNHGIHLRNVSVAELGPPDKAAPQIVNNGGFGIFCDPAPAVAQVAGGIATITGNTAGAENCPGI